MGVDVFFVISGFVVTGALMTSYARHGELRVGHFFQRRFLRLAPALGLVVAATVITTLLLFSPFGRQQDVYLTALAAIGGLANAAIALTTGDYFDPPAAENPLLHTWSLSVEAQFYLLLPLILLISIHLSRKLARASWRVIFGLVLAAVAVLSLFVALLHSTGYVLLGQSELLGFYSPLGRIWEFSAGALLALASAPKNLPSRVADLCGWLGLSMILLSSLIFSGETSVPGPWTLLPVGGATLLIFAGSSGQGAVTRLLSRPSFVYLGGASYSLYLWHYPLIVYARHIWPDSPVATLGATAASIVPALIAYHFFEQPLRSKTPSGSSRHKLDLFNYALLPAALTLVFFLMAEAVLKPAFSTGRFGSTRSGDVGQMAFHQSVSSSFYPCANEEISKNALYWEEFIRCHQSQPDGEPSVVILGDSHAEHLFLGLAELEPKTNMAYFIRGALPVFGEEAEMDAILDYVLQSPGVSTVILTAFWAGRGVPVEEVRDILVLLDDAGKDVFVTDGVPLFSISANGCRAPANLLSVGVVCDEDFPGGEDSPHLRSLGEASDGLGSVKILQTHRYFCAGQVCSMANGNNLLYRDSNHLNINGSRFVARQLFRDYSGFRLLLSSPG